MAELRLQDGDVVREVSGGRKWIIRDRLVYGADDYVGPWVNYEMTADQRPGSLAVQVIYVAIGILQKGVPPQELDESNILSALAGGVYFFSHHDDGELSDIEVAVRFDDDMADPDLVARVLDYPFGQCDIRRITIQIDEANEQAIRQAERMGFVLEGIKRDMAAPGRDVILMGLLREESRFWQRWKQRQKQAA